MLRVAAIQMTSTDDRSENLAKAHALLDQALERKVDLVAFPENFTLMTDNAVQKVRSAETMKGVTVETLQEWAAENDVWILAGSVPIQAPKKKGQKATQIFNSSVLVSADGEVVARYDKIHLFDVNVPGDRSYNESSLVLAGRKPVIAETPWGRFGLSICYDLRFPELYRAYSQEGCRVLFVPSAFTVPTGKAHWDALTRARAIENQCFVVAPGQWGQHPGGRETFGHTRIINPWGRVIAERPAGEGVVWADLDFDEQDRMRADLPALNHRKIL